jgi:omega-6 fatty acid desaturase (delta-12 desaturase)
MFGLFSDAPEYIERKNRDFKPPNFTVAEIRAVVPKELFEKNTTKALSYVVRDISFALAFYKLSTYIDPFVATLGPKYGLSPLAVFGAKWALWATYWWWQGVALAGWWCLAHEAGHGTLCNSRLANHLIGFPMHTFLMVPYFSWRATHAAHHKATSSIERDENFVPRTRTDYGCPPEKIAKVSDYHDIFEETPIYTLGKLLFMQVWGMQTYFMFNTLGSPMYPAGTNHFSPLSPLFKPRQRLTIVLTDLGLAVMASVLYTYAKTYGVGAFLKDYFVPYIIANHWIVMLTYLHHSDPTMPHYREKEWSYARGAMATVDRPLLGWIGRFFLHNVSHDHVAHHFFFNVPFYNQPKVTEHLKKILGEHYNYDSTNTFRALYRSFKNCMFIEDTGDVVFYKDRSGNAHRKLATKTD